MSKVTQWFDSHEDNPVHEGLYEHTSNQYGAPVCCGYWNGFNWEDGLGGVIIGLSGYYWRGLAEKPEGK